jgi:hypothetical protein
VRWGVVVGVVLGALVLVTAPLTALVFTQDGAVRHGSCSSSSSLR